MELSTLTEVALSDLIDVSLDLTLSDAELNINVNDPHPHHLITRLRSLTLRGSEESNVGLGKLPPALPWSQLQSLDFADLYVKDLRSLVKILHQTPMLQVLSLLICKSHINALQEFTMPSLRYFRLVTGYDVDEGTDLDAILHSFACPSLVRLELRAYSLWTVESLETIKRQYNMQGLEELNLASFPLSISSILQNAPMLRTLSVGSGAILDDVAITGISNGTLGRFLTNLDLCYISCDVNEVVGMVETRMKTVNGLIGNSCSWIEDITLIKDLGVHIGHDRDEKLNRDIAKLEEAGINISLWP